MWVENMSEIYSAAIDQFRPFCDTLEIHLKACLKISDVQLCISDTSEECWNSN